MGFKSTEWAYAVPDLTGPERAVLVALAHCRNDKTGACYPGQETLVEMTSLSEKTVRRALANLESGESPAIARKPRFAGRYRTSDEYFLLFDNHRSDRPPVTATTGQTDHRSESPSPPVTLSVTTGHSDHPIEDEQEVEQEEEQEVSSSPSARDIVAEFDRAYAQWPKKAEKKRSLEAFIRAAKSRDVDALTADIIRFGHAYAASTERQFVPALCVWLRGERWTDDLPAVKTPSDADWNAFVNEDIRDGFKFSQGKPVMGGPNGMNRAQYDAWVQAERAKGPRRRQFGQGQPPDADARFAQILERGRRLTRTEQNMAAVAEIAAREAAEQGQCAHRWLDDGTCNFCTARRDDMPPLAEARF